MYYSKLEVIQLKHILQIVNKKKLFIKRYIAVPQILHHSYILYWKDIGPINDNLSKEKNRLLPLFTC